MSEEKHTAKEKSDQRSNKMLMQLADIGLNAAAESLLPVGGGSLYEIMKIILQDAHTFIQDKRNERMSAFLRELIYTDKCDDRENKYEKKFDQEDFYSLLSCALQDEEEEKTKYYTRMFKAILYGRLISPFKIHFIKMLRQITLAEIELMREVYIAHQFRLQDGGDKEKQIAGILNPNDPIMHIYIQNLVRLGLIRRDIIKDENKVHELKSNELYDKSELLDHFISTIFYPYELNPEVIGRKAWSGLNAFIICSDLTKYSHVIADITNALRDERIESASISSIKIKRLHLSPIDGLTILVGGAEAWKEDDIQHLKSFKSVLTLYVETEENSPLLKQLEVPPQQIIIGYFNFKGNYTDELKRLGLKLKEIVDSYENPRG